MSDSYHYIPHMDDERIEDTILSSIFLSENSKKTVIYQVKQGRRLVGYENYYDYLVNPSEMDKKMEDPNISMHTRFNVLKSTLTMLNKMGWKVDYNNLYNKWYKVFSKSRLKMKRFYDANKPNDKQKDNMVEWNKVIEVRDTLKYGSDEHLLLSMYTMIPPRRQMDYAFMRVYTNPSDYPEFNHNLFHLYSDKFNSPFMYLNTFKTAKFFKSYFNKFIPLELSKIVRASLIERPRLYLFSRKNGEPFKDTNSFQKFSNGILKKVLKKEGMSVNVLRHSYATYLNKMPNLSLEDLKKASYQMGHAVIKHLEYVHHIDGEQKKVEKAILDVNE